MLFIGPQTKNVSFVFELTLEFPFNTMLSLSWVLRVGTDLAVAAHGRGADDCGVGQNGAEGRQVCGV